MTTPTLYYKSTKEDGGSTYGQGKWHLPKKGQPGAWRIAYGDLMMCDNGIHACQREDLIFWLGARMFVFELAGGELQTGSNKVLNRKGRLVFELVWGEEVARRYVDSTREHFGLSRIDWPWPSRSASPWVLPSEWPWVWPLTWPSGTLSPWSVSRSAWLTNNLFDHLEGRK